MELRRLWKRVYIKHCSIILKIYIKEYLVTNLWSNISLGDLKIHTENVFINHPDLGIYFQHFDGSRYIPNSETAARFPEDEKILNLKSSNVN
jgi:hypothetical protein